MKGILSGIFPDNVHPSIVDQLKTTQRAVVSGIGAPMSKAFFLQDIYRSFSKHPVLFVVHDENELAELTVSLSLFNHLEPRLFSALDPETQSRRLEFMTTQETLFAPSRFVITTSDFLQSPVPYPDHLRQESFVLSRGDTVLLKDLYERLLEMGYRPNQDAFLPPGTYRMEGGSINIAPLSVNPGSAELYKIDLLDNQIDALFALNQTTKDIKEIETFTLYPTRFLLQETSLVSYIPENCLVITDEIDLHDEAFYGDFTKSIHARKSLLHLKITSFPDEDDHYEHLRYLSVLKYYSITDFTNDLKEKYISGWKTVLMTKNKTEIANILDDYELPYSFSSDYLKEHERGIVLLPFEEEQTVPRSFQNTGTKIAVLTDREIFRIKKKSSLVDQKTVLDFLTSLKPGDYVVHNDHGIGRFIGIDKKTIDGITKEYIAIQYAGNDKLFIPTDQAGKVNRFIAGDEEREPKLTRLDSGEWALVNKKVRKETEKIAKELLALYAKRKLAQGYALLPDTKEQRLFEETFAYEETPGQMKAIKEVKEDLEKAVPMDRLVCGDVGFGKTEVALRAAFKAFITGKQVAFISPVTILTDQHYKTFIKRMRDFNVRIAMMSRFQTPKEQNRTLEELEKGNIDIVIGTHRLLQEDVKFKDLGLMIVDEEQKFGVKQKERLKEMRCNVHILTLTATPIPRTLNMSLNKLRDITTITTPPPGRLPIITEVRKYNEQLIRDAILAELKRQGQVYFLHNKVQTIEGVADKLRFLIPEARFVVAHGQMDNKLLEERILDFKEGKFDVLVSSTIIENGIDLPNANTLIVNNSDQFGLSQLYQLRGRVGRSKKQAYTYLLYSGQRLSPDAKKRLRAIVEASELGSGFQIAMKDLEIRGAGDILGANQHGVIKSVGVSHFIRMLNQTIEDMKAGTYSEELEVKPEENVTVELPLTSFIPETFIPDYKEKIAIYQKMSSMDSLDELKELKQNLHDEYGLLPEEVKNLFRVLEVKSLAKSAALLAVRIVSYTLQERFLELHMSKRFTPYQVMNLLQDPQNGSAWIISGDKLKIRVKDLGLDWYEGLKAALNRLIEGKNAKTIEEKMKLQRSVTA